MQKRDYDSLDVIGALRLAILVIDESMARNCRASNDSFFQDLLTTKKHLERLCVIVKRTRSGNETTVSEGQRP